MPRVTEIDRSCFDGTTLALYWAFLTERQNIYVRRVLGQAQPPWTTDPILNVEFITNVYRILDPGTSYLVDAILSVDNDAVDRVFNVMLYRLMGSVPDTHRHLGFQIAAEFNPDTFGQKLAELPDDYRIFGDAYRVASYSIEGGDSKVANVASMFAYLAGGMEETMRRLNAAREVVEVYKVFESMKGFGEFLAHQIVVDLLYPDNDGVAILPFGENEFAKAGPGARKGIWALMAADIKPANLMIVMEWLRDNQQAEFARCGLTFPFLVGADEDLIQPMSLCDIQASLCEFYKYYRIWSGERSVQTRRYVPGEGRTLTRGREVHSAGYDAAMYVEWHEDKQVWRCSTWQQSITDEEDAREAISDGISADEFSLAEDGTAHFDKTEVTDKSSYQLAPPTSEFSVSPVPGVNISIVINVYGSDN